MEDHDKIGPLLDIADLEPSGNYRRKERRSFYDMPQTLSEEDDTFGILTNNVTMDSQMKRSSLKSSFENSVSTGLLVEIESSQSSNDSYEPFTKSKLQSSKIDLDSALRSLSLTSSRGMSVSSLTNSRCFGDISQISQPVDQISGKSLLSNDSVFESVCTAEKDPPNWEMIMNEAKILASTINKKDPFTSRLKGSILSPAGLDSPLLDLEKEFSKPDEFLVPLTPDRSPVKDLTKQIATFNEKTIEDQLPGFSTESNTDTVSVDDGDLNKEYVDCEENKYVHSLDLRPLPDHEIDGIQPLIYDETPKIGVKFSSRNQLSKENIKPRQILNKGTRTPSKPERLNTTSATNSVEKQVKSKVQKSNVRRTSMVMAQQKNLNELVKERIPPRTSADAVPFNKVDTKPANKTGNEGSSKSCTTTKVSTPQIRNPSYKNIQSKINSGKMPSVKTAMPSKSFPLDAKTYSAKKPVCQSISTNSGLLAATKVGATPCSKPLSNKRLSSATPMTAPRNVLQRQGSNVIALPPRPSSTTPLKSRQSLLFATPGVNKPVTSLKPSTPARKINGLSNTTKPPTPSRLKPPTPSRLPSTKKFRTPRHFIGGASTKSDQASHLKNRPGQTKSGSSLRFSTLPSPSLTNKENNSVLVCSTPDVGNAVATNGRISSLPSPIHVMRRPV